MKKSLFFISLLPIILFGCSKGNSNEDPKSEDELVEVNFKAEGFNQEVSPMKLKGATLERGFHQPGKSEITNLVLFLYDEYGRLVYTKENFVSDKDYNPIAGANEFKFKVPKGNYKIGLMGHNRGYGGLNFFVDQRDMNAHTIQLDGANNGPNELNLVDIRESYIHRYSDVRLNKDTTLAPLQLVRLTSRLEVNIEDKIPAEASTILVGNMINSSIYPFSTDKNSIKRSGYIRFGVEGQVGKENTVLATPIYANTANPNQTNTLSVAIYNRNNVLISYTEIPNVILKPNYITKLSGKLFTNYTPDANGSLKTTIWKDYSSTIIEAKF